MDNCQKYPVSHGKGLTKKLLAAADKHLISAAARKEGIFKGFCDDAPLCLESGLPAEDNVGAAGERPADGLKGLSPHDHRMPQGKLPETAPVGRNIPRDGASPADHPVIRHGGNYGDNHFRSLLSFQGPM
jgi:hypothetical protein